MVLATENALVILTGRIGVDGYLNDLRPVERAISSAPATEFVESAIEAVRQWRYTPTLLNGSPVDVSITVTVRYTPR
jgi:protein TonB